jgi:hypothetical protein
MVNALPDCRFQFKKSGQLLQTDVDSKIRLQEKAENRISRTPLSLNVSSYRAAAMPFCVWAIAAWVLWIARSRQPALSGTAARNWARAARNCWSA